MTVLKLIKIIFIISLAGLIFAFAIVVALSATYGSVNSKTFMSLTPVLILINVFGVLPISILGGLFGMIVSVRYGRNALFYGAGAFFLGLLHFYFAAHYGAFNGE